MKTKFFNSAFAMMLVVVSMFTFTSCDEETVETPFKEAVVGTWDITSHKVSGTEYIPLLMESGSIQFKAYTGAQGVFVQVVHWPDEDFVSLSGPYTVDEARNEVHMQYEDEIIVAEIEITNEDEMLWRSLQDEYPLVIKATRR